MHNVVFVEGVSGVGKSTTSALLRDRLSGLGHAVRRYAEGDGGCPLDPFGGTYPPKMELAAYTRAYAQLWQTFVNAGVSRRRRRKTLRTGQTESASICTCCNGSRPNRISLT